MLMVHPEHFDIQYSINPHMTDETGQLNKIDKPKALQQWQSLKSTFEKLNMNVHVIDDHSGLPDMVFCANQTFPFFKNNQKHMVLSQMHSTHRQPEVMYFKDWAEKNEIQTHTIQSSAFEGMGDLLWDYEANRLYGGYGFRTKPEVYTELERITGYNITTFELTNDNFYHLDTCLAILKKDTAAFVEEAFSPEGLETLRRSFTTLIQVPYNEAMNQLACNMCTPNGTDIVIQMGAKNTTSQLKNHGFKVHEVDTSEYIKSGGSVFCMKILLY